MKSSDYLISTVKEAPNDAKIISHQLMIRAGLISKLASGLYSYLPIGLKIIQKVEKIIREEMNRSMALELLMPVAQPAELWQESKRWEEYGPELLRFQDRHERDFCMGPTHEEVITNIAKQYIRSYKQLPINFYQIQTKFRDEIRPRFGVMRSREFIMKDAYSFHMDEESLGETYQVMHQTYCNIFDRLGLDYRPVLADSGAIGGDSSHEFHVLAESGEDELLYDDESDFAANVEIAKNHPNKKNLKSCRGIEVGHIFQLGTKYSNDMKATFIDESGKPCPMIMGCYGIGVSRIVAAAIEQKNDENGMIFPQSIAPFEVVITPIGYDKSSKVKEAVEELYSQLLADNYDVLLDDRSLRPGVMFSEAELLGIPHRITISEKTLIDGKFEYKNRSSSEASLIESNELMNLLKID